MITGCLGLLIGGACLLTSHWTAALRDGWRLPPAPPESVAGATTPFLVSVERSAGPPERVRGAELARPGEAEDAAVTRTAVSLGGRVAPIGFLDSGATRDFAGRVMNPTSAGVGFDYRFSDGLTGYLLGSAAVNAGPVTRPGDFQLGLMLRFTR